MTSTNGSHHNATGTRPTTNATRTDRKEKVKTMRPFWAAVRTILFALVVTGIVFNTKVRRLSNTSDLPGSVAFPGLVGQEREERQGKNVINNTHPPHHLQKHHDKIMLVHVGKAAGETLKNHLRVTCYTRHNVNARNTCLREWHQQDVTSMGINMTNLTASTIRQESEISKRTVAYLHCNLLHPSNNKENAALHDEITSNLFPIRSPIDRIFSWFGQIHPERCNNTRDRIVNCNYKRILHRNKTIVNKFARCFPTLQAFVSSLGPPPPENMMDSHSGDMLGHGNDAVTFADQLYSQDDDCAQTAHDILAANSSKVRVLGHSYFNFNYYVNHKAIRFEKRNVLAIRTEHFWSDFLQLDHLLGGQGKYKRPNGVVAFTHRDETVLPMNMTVNTQGIFYLCCELLSLGEIQVYLHILERADNLNATTKQQSKMALLEQCGGGGGGGFRTLDDLQQKCQEKFSIAST